MEHWIRTGLLGKGINQFIDIEAQTDHSFGPTFAQVSVTHVTEEARRTAIQRATLITAAPDLLAACEAALQHIRRQHVGKVWNEHYSMDTVQAEEYIDAHPLDIEVILREALTKAKGA